MVDLMWEQPGALGGAIWSGVDDVFHMPSGDIRGYGFREVMFLWALSAALMSGADVALIYEKMKAEGKEKETKEALGRYSTFELLGIAIATPIGSIIGKSYGLQYSTLAMAVPLSLALVAMLFVKSVPKEKKEHQHYLKIFKDGLSYFWQNHTLRALAFDSVSISILAFMAIWTYQPQLKSVGIGLAYFGLVHSAGTLMEILVLNNFTFLEKRVSTKGYLLVSGLVVGISFMLLTVAGVFSPLFVVLIFGFGFTRRVLLTHYINKHIKADQRATVLSSVSMLDTLGRAILYPLVGVAAMWNLSVTHLSLGILVIAALVFSKVKIEMLSDL
ncbi:MAG: MFS transporter [Nanoarchaeota archaeon]|nr:MFS transporter [Nanoarchaeota archaeon]